MGNNKKINKKTSQAEKKDNNLASLKHEGEKRADKRLPAERVKLDYKEITKVTMILTAICLVVAALLAVTNYVTEEKIRQMDEQKRTAACSEVFAASDSDVIYFENIKALSNNIPQEGYLVLDRSIRPVGCILLETVKGYGGNISVMVGFDMNGSVTGISILSQSETPGLGSHVTDDQFLDQFKGTESRGADRQFALKKDGGSVDAVTAATFSSRAVTSAVNSAYDDFLRLSDSGVFDLPGGYKPASQPVENINNAQNKPHVSDTDADSQHEKLPLNGDGRGDSPDE